MSRIDDLIKKHCPEGVEFKKLGEVASYTRGVTYSRDEERQDGQIKILRSNNITLSSNTLNFDDVKFVSGAVRVRTDQWLRTNDILISAASGSKAHVGKVAYIREDIDYCFGGFMAVLRTNKQINSRFLFHLLIGHSFNDYLEMALSTTTINNLSASIMKAFPIPIPPLPVQHEIVIILDKFIKLEAKLEVELEAEQKERQVQYEYYRNALLKLDGKSGLQRIDTLIAKHCPKGVEYIDVGNLANVGTGSSNAKDADNTGEYPFYVRSKEIKRLRTYEFDEQAIIIPGEGIIGEIFHFINGKYALHQRAYRINFIDPRIITKFAYHYFTNNYKQFIVTHAVTAAVSSIRKPMIEKFPIPIPPLPVQREIVTILDKFDALINDISSGLPAEIEARRQQYAYYRNRLLTFKKIK